MLFDLNQQAAELPEAWRSAVLGRVGAANIKVLRMDARSIADEVHDYSEGLLVISGRLRLQVAGKKWWCGPVSCIRPRPACHTACCRAAKARW